MVLGQGTLVQLRYQMRREEKCLGFMGSLRADCERSLMLRTVRNRRTQIPRIVWSYLFVTLLITKVVILLFCGYLLFQINYGLKSEQMVFKTYNMGVFERKKSCVLYVLSNLQTYQSCHVISCLLQGFYLYSCYYYFFYYYYYYYY